MKSFLSIVCGSLVLLSNVGIALSQPLAEDQAVFLSGSYFRPLGSGTGSVNLDAAYSYHFDDPSFELGLRQSFTLNHNDDAPDVWNAVTAPFVNYNFLGDNLFGIPHPTTIVPFVGAFVGAVWNDEDFTGTVGPQGGLKAYLSRNTFIAATYRYEWFFDEIGDADETQDANHVVSLGIGYQWGGSRTETQRG
jgi:hypothetical protein